MGYRHRLQLLKPNYVPIDCTAEVVPEGLHLLRINGKPLFRFSFDKIQGFSCPSEDNLELEVHMGPGKMGKVKLQSPGPHVMGPSAVQALAMDLETALTGGKGAKQSDLSPTPEPRHQQREATQQEPPSPATAASVSSASESPLQSSASSSPYSTAPSSRRSTSESFKGAEATSRPSSPGTWGPGRRVRSLAADFLRRAGSKTEHSGGKQASSIQARGRASRDGSWDADAGQSLAQDGEGEAQPAGPPALRRTTSTPSARRTTSDGQADVGYQQPMQSHDRNKTWAQPQHLSGRSQLLSPAQSLVAANYSNPLFDDRKEGRQREDSEETSTEVSTSPDSSLTDNSDESEVIEEHRAPSQRNFDRWQQQDPAKPAVQEIHSTADREAGRQLAKERLETIERITKEKEGLERELARARAGSVSGSGGSPSQHQRHRQEAVEAQEALEALKCELQESQGLASEYASTLSLVREENRRLQESKEDIAKELGEHVDRLTAVQTQLSKEQEAKDTAVLEVSELKQRLSKVERQAREAEDCAREADAACVAANEARAALRGELNAAKAQSQRGQGGALWAGDGGTAAQVEMLQSELLMVDEAAAKAVEKAKQESARANALQAQLDQARAAAVAGPAPPVGQAAHRTASDGLRQNLEEVSKRAREYLRSLKEAEREAADLKDVISSHNEQLEELEMTRNAALSQAQAAHDDAVSAFRRADAAEVEVQTLREQLARHEKNAATSEALEELQRRLSAAMRESRQHQAAAQSAEEALDEVHKALEQSRLSSGRLGEKLDAKAQQADLLAQQLAELQSNTSRDRAMQASCDREVQLLRNRLEGLEEQLRSSKQAASKAEARAAAAEQAEAQVEELICRMEALAEALQVERRTSTRAAEEVAQLRGALQQTQVSLERAHQEHDQCLQDAEAVIAARDAHQHDVSRLRRRIDELEASLAELNATKSELGKLRSLLKSAGKAVKDSEAGQAQAENRVKVLEEQLRRANQMSRECQQAAEKAMKDLIASQSHAKGLQERTAELEGEMERLGRLLQATSSRWSARPSVSGHAGQQTAAAVPQTLVQQLSAPPSPPQAEHRGASAAEALARGALRADQVQRLEALEAKLSASGSLAGQRGAQPMHPSKRPQQPKSYALYKGYRSDDESTAGSMSAECSPLTEKRSPSARRRSSRCVQSPEPPSTVSFSYAGKMRRSMLKGVFK